MSTVTTDPHAHAEHDIIMGQPKDLKRWLYTTNHKDIGTLYLLFALTMFFIGGAMAMVIRAELFQPGLQIVQPDFFNQMTTVHGLIMVFGAVMPAFTGLANWLIPMMIGAPDMALPRMNNWSFWIYLLPLASCWCLCLWKVAALVLAGLSMHRYQPPIAVTALHFLCFQFISWVFHPLWALST